jgi:multidrug efflux pump subunit AcrA (membrane-fusion protein)
MAGTAVQDEIRRLREQLAQVEAIIAEHDIKRKERMRQRELQLRQRKYEENQRARQHELEMAKLQLLIEQTKAKAGNMTPAAINIIQQEDGFFKLEGPTNYEFWRNEAFIQALAQALAIEAKHIIINKEKPNSTSSWQTINASATEYFKKKNEGKLASPRPATDSTPTTDSMPATPSTPTTDDDLKTELKDDKDTIHIIPQDTAILDPMPKVVGAEAVGAAANKKDPNSLSSKADVPKTRCGRSKKQSIVDPMVLLAWDLINSINQDKNPDMWFCTFLASPNANQWQAALEGG